MKTKKIISAFLCVSLFFTYIIVGSISSLAAVWGGGTTTPTLSDGVYLIDTGEKLAWFAQSVNNGNQTIKGRITADIQLNSSGSTAHEWIPIGTSTEPFLGILDGGSYVISGLYIDNSDQDNQGLFGYIGTTVTTGTDSVGDTINIYTPSQVNYVVLEGASITGKASTGGIVGYSLGGSILGCSFSGTVTGTSNVAGIVGNNRNSSTVVNCINYGTVNGNIRVSGIAGYNYGSAIVNGSCNAGTISAASYVGGLAGTNAGSYVRHSYNRGIVNATGNQVGGIAGYVTSGNINCNYTIGTVNYSGTGELVGTAFGNVFYGADVSKTYYDAENDTMTDDFATPAEHELMMDDSFITTLNSAIFSYTGLDPDIALTSMYKYNEYNIFVGDFFLENGGYPIMRYELTTWDGSVSTPNTQPNGAYIISNGSELAWFAKLVNGTLSGISQNTAANAVVTNDILLNVDIFDDNSNVWLPIGTSATPYIGTFDGTGHKISGIYINQADYDYAGLFGVLGTGGVVQNVFTGASQIAGYRYVGIIAGWNDGTVQNCHNSSNINSEQRVGGIVGLNNTGTVQNCTNTGAIKGSTYCGGIVGYNSSVIRRCYNTGYISSTTYGGGIVGGNYNTVSDCYNLGSVFSANYSGGITGLQSGGTIMTCYSVGYIRALGSSARKGAIAGDKPDGSISYCYYNSSVAGCADANATGMTTLQMAQSTSVSNFSGFSSSYWIVRASDTYFDYYPELRVFSSSTTSSIQLASKKSAAVLKPEYVLMDIVDGEMNTYYANTVLAVEHIGTRAGTVVAIGDSDISQTVEVNGIVTLTSDGNARTLSRTAQATGNMFAVSSNAALIIDAGYESTDDAPLLTIDGGRYAGHTGLSIVNVAYGGRLDIYAGASLCNNSSTCSGSGIYNNGGIVYMYGGKVSENTASGDNLCGGGIYNNGGEIYAEGGSVTNNMSTSHGGGIYLSGAYAVVELSALTVSNNTTSIGNGGGIYNENSPVTMSGGSISSNTSYCDGGGVYNGGTLSISAGVIEGNTAANGAAIYQNGTLNMSGDAFVNSNNVIYLKTGHTITSVDKLNTSGIAAHLYVENYTVGTRILDGDYVAVNYASFIADPRGSTTLYINSTGYLIDRASTPVARLSVFGASGVEYTSVKEAVEAAGTQPGVITLISDDIIESPVTVNGDIKIKGDEVAYRTITRYHTCTEEMFIVSEGASLEFGFDGTAGNTALTVDGSYHLNGIKGASVVKNYGTFTMSEGATITSNYTTGDGAAIYNAGTLVIAGGDITRNIAEGSGGAVYNAQGTATMSNGSISGNTSHSNGGAVANDGEGSVGSFSMTGGTIENNTAQNGGGVYSQGGSVDISSGTQNYQVTYQLATANGEGGYYTDSDGDIVYTQRTLVLQSPASAVVQNNTASVNGGGVAVTGGTASLHGGILEGNSAANGGGAYVGDDADFSIHNHSFEYAANYTLLGLDGQPIAEGGVPVSIVEQSVLDTASVQSAMTGNTASANGSGVYVDGTFAMGADTGIASDNVVYLCQNSVINLPESFTSTGTLAVFRPYEYIVGTPILTGVDLSTMKDRFTAENSQFYISDAGLLVTDRIVTKETSTLFIDYTDSLLCGIGIDTLTAYTLTQEIVSNGTGYSLTVYDANGADITDTLTVLTTGCTVELMDSLNEVIHTVNVVIVGDTSKNTQINGEDAVIASYIASGTLTKASVGADVYRAADANNDGIVNDTDVELLVQSGLQPGEALVTQPTGLPG